MHRRYFKTAVATILTALLLCPSPLLAWGNTGHEAVAYVAWQRLTPTTKARVISLLTRVPALRGLAGEGPGYEEWVEELPTSAQVDIKYEYLFMRAAIWADSIKHKGLHDSDTPPAHSNEDPVIGFGDEPSHGYWHFIDNPFA